MSEATMQYEPGGPGEDQVLREYAGSTRAPIMTPETAGSAHDQLQPSGIAFHGHERGIDIVWTEPNATAGVSAVTGMFLEHRHQR
jgi:hypothetical protein